MRASRFIYTVKPMTPQQRQEEFNRLFDAIPGKNMDRIRRVCEILHYQPNTVRIFRMAQPPRMIPERSLRILRDTLSA